MRKAIIVLAVALVVFALSGTVVCEEAQDISWLDGTTWEKSDNPFKGSKIKVTVENGVGTGVSDQGVERWKDIHVDKKGRIVLEGLYSFRSGEMYLKMDVKFNQERTVMVLTPKEFGPLNQPPPPYKMKLVGE